MLEGGRGSVGSARATMGHGLAVALSGGGEGRLTNVQGDGEGWMEVEMKRQLEAACCQPVAGRPWWGRCLPSASLQVKLSTCFFHSPSLQTPGPDSRSPGRPTQSRKKSIHHRKVHQETIRKPSGNTVAPRRWFSPNSTPQRPPKWPSRPPNTSNTSNTASPSRNSPRFPKVAKSRSVP